MTVDWRSEVLEVRPRRRSEAAFYNRVAPVYEIAARVAESSARKRVLELGADGDRAAVLEVATGTGVQLVALARGNPAGRTVGVELAGGMLARSRQRLREAGLRGVPIPQADARQLPLRDASFDVVVNSYMLDLLPREDIPRALREFRRVLRPGGRLVLSSMTKGERPWHRFWDALYARGLSLTSTCRGILAAPVLAELGFVAIERHYIAQMTVPSEVVTAVKPRGVPPARAPRQEETRRHC